MMLGQDWTRHHFSHYHAENRQGRPAPHLTPIGRNNAAMAEQDDVLHLIDDTA